MDSAVDPTPLPDEIQEERLLRSESTERPQADPGATLENDVKQLVGSVSTWWSGFSKRSQEQLNEVKAQIDSQGGIVSIAKREAARFEAQLSQAQKAARDDVQAADDDNAEGTSSSGPSGHRKSLSAIDIDGWGTAGLISGGAEPVKSPSGKGKGREVEGDDGAAVERLQERAHAGRNEGAAGQRVPDEDKGETLFDADEAAHIVKGSEFQVLEDAAQTAMHTMQSFWERMQADPRINNLQQSVAKTLQSITLPKEQVRDGEQIDEEIIDSPQAKRNLALPDLSKQFQAAFPNLDLKESQTMAKRYFEVSQSAARDWGKEMGTLMSDLVKVVPPEEQQHDAALTKSFSSMKAASVSSEKVGTAVQASTEEDDFDWDKEIDVGQTGLQTTTAPPTASWDDDAEAQVQTVSEAEEGSAKPGPAKRRGDEQDDDEDDSDWE